MTDPNLKAYIYLTNDVKIAPITVTPILHLSNGKKFTLAEVKLEPSGTAVVSINDELRQQGISPWATLFGYVEVQYTFPWSAICASVQSVDVAHSLIFSYGLSELRGGESKAEGDKALGTDQAIEGLWWKQEPNVTGFVALSNTTSEAMAATLQVSDAVAGVLAQHALTISPNGTKIVNLTELGTASTSEGGLRVQFKGPAGALIVCGGVEDKNVGVSAGLQFRSAPPPSTEMTTEIYAVPGLMSGTPDPMMSFPAGTEFTPYTVLRNVSRERLSVGLTMHWTEGATAHSAQMGRSYSGRFRRKELTSAR